MSYSKIWINMCTAEAYEQNLDDLYVS